MDIGNSRYGAWLREAEERNKEGKKPPPPPKPLFDKETIKVLPDIGIMVFTAIFSSVIFDFIIRHVPFFSNVLKILGYRLLFTAGLIGLGFTFVYIKRKWLRSYGYIEIGISVFSAFEALTQFSLSGKAFHAFIACFSAIYISVRGFENIKAFNKKEREKIEQYWGKWKYIKRIEAKQQNSL